jgi:rhodanese-related sulfurtransferase
MKRSIFALVLSCLVSTFLAPVGINAADAKAEAKTYKNVGVEEFDKLRQEKNTVVLDVRTAEEVAKAKIPGSVVIDFNAEDFDKQVAKLDKSKTYLVHCAAGGRSARACKKMEKLDFVKLYKLEGGLTAWQAAGKPVEKK